MQKRPQQSFSSGVTTKICGDLGQELKHSAHLFNPQWNINFSFIWVNQKVDIFSFLQHFKRHCFQPSAKFCLLCMMSTWRETCGSSKCGKTENCQVSPNCQFFWNSHLDNQDGWTANHCMMFVSDVSNCGILVLESSCQFMRQSALSNEMLDGWSSWAMCEQVLVTTFIWLFSKCAFRWGSPAPLPRCFVFC